ncbi:putative DNA-binding transcriptional regulator [Klebsiella pneumoniae]|nr:putative DNA-binding transcriptional regulator [Klebsiella pneumoniae subsp. pneumoniae]MCS6048572.1 putative DNA-binding transcriptional regulator [Klebsiella pneumoniae subsp. pneumoniae]MDE5247265.1 putative DNA-binding transcriptional regulator [Klebsiella pneumoniae]
MLKERMTPEEIAHLTGYSRQTINKWVRKEGWQTSPRPGVQGGKARLVHVNEQVREFIRSAQRVAETPGIYSPHDSDLESLLLTLSKELTPQRAEAAYVFVAARGDHRVTASVRDPRSVNHDETER